MGGKRYSYEQLEAMTERLQREVSRHIKIEQDLITARNALDADVARLRVQQQLNSRALEATSPAELASICVKTVIEAFEFECVAMLRWDADAGDLERLAQFGIDWMPDRLRFDPSVLKGERSLIFDGDDPVLKAWPELDLVQAMVCPFCDEAGGLYGLVIAGRCRTKAAYYDPISPKLGAPFAVMVQQIGGLWLSYRLTLVVRERNRELREALDEVEKYKGRLEAENVYLRNEIDLEHNFGEIIGTSDALQRALRLVSKVSASDTTVLVQGESGTGKELIARAIHGASPRRERPLVKLNCAALPATLVESELFGHERGAFSGAHARRPGRFELADQGTLFLDEIGEMPIETQVKLLRVLQEGELERLGGTETIEVDVRIIAATNRELVRDVAAGRFREDLFYRLSVFPIRVPPLRERKGDVRVLAEHFTRRMAGKLGKPIESISARSLERLERYHWPGNVRELQNLIERAVILSTGTCLEIEPTTAPPAPPSAFAPIVGPRTMREVEIELITATLERCNWVVGGKSGAARELDLPESTLRERIHRYGIVRS